MNVGLSFICMMLASSSYTAKLLRQEAEENQAAAEKELNTLKEKLASEQWAGRVMNEMRPYSTLSHERAGVALIEAIDKHVNDLHWKQKAAASIQESPPSEKVGFV